MSALDVVILGCGSSMGVPRVDGQWGACDPAEPRNRRTRCSLLVRRCDPARGPETTVLVDTSPDLREQLLDAGVRRLDGVLITHDHADHTHGIDDLRAFSARHATPIAVYGSAATMGALARKFPYIFDETLRPLAGTFKPEGRTRSLAEHETVTIAGVDVTPVRVPHGNAEVFGYRIDGLAYVTDAKCVPPEALARLRGARVLVVNALFRTPHPTHLSIPEAVEAAARVGAERTFLTHLTHDVRHADLEAELPPGVAPAFDGLTVRL